MAADEIVHPQDISNEMLQVLFEIAYMETSYSDEGLLRVTDGYTFLLLQKARASAFKYGRSSILMVLLDLP
jgi:hypothetical protein